jgi:hypothetical protein
MTQPRSTLCLWDSHFASGSGLGLEAPGHPLSRSGVLGGRNSGVHSGTPTFLGEATPGERWDSHIA